jgi:uncharacterized membrane protein
MTDTASPPIAILPIVSRREERTGFLLVFLSALMWSFGGTFARFIHTDDSWTVVFWRSVWAAAFLLCFMVWRDGWRGTLKLFRDMGLPGLAVAICFAVASTCFVVALSYTTVANILLMQAGVPLLAALFAWALFREKVSVATWVAIAAVIAGVAIMVSESLDGAVSPIGDGLALLIAVMFSIATVITRRFAHVRMTPATCLGTILAAAFVDLCRFRPRHGLSLCLRRGQSRPRPCVLRHRCQADPRGHSRVARHLRADPWSDMGLAHSFRGAVGAHHPRRRGRGHGAACSYRIGIQASDATRAARCHRPAFS